MTFGQKSLPATERSGGRAIASSAAGVIADSLASDRRKTMNSLKQLQDCGQSIWLDYIRRDLTTSGEFQRLVEQDGVHGVTSNPTIFDKAIAGGPPTTML
jgi:hypothetical protein